ncbi:hypothetical protein [Chenggangzhangella methanolivorans]|uniref:Uncharacterized protein n=1 Tax=Chenggangzhangella methanolivorans TaxID=1437009 RepID=A0A9E6RDM5_9HYPH|nr:hypothetical protein [Chenggangzhangella methanolivorans]QZO01404.1 hypothetical protein K6K41_08100 [Chenggangzhangella methanolivorans]
MPYYRVYHVNEADRVRSVDDAECRDDREAIAFARERLKGMPVELWNLARRVARLDAQGVERAFQGAPEGLAR